MSTSTHVPDVVVVFFFLHEVAQSLNKKRSVEVGTELNIEHLLNNDKPRRSVQWIISGEVFINFHATSVN